MEVHAKNKKDLEEQINEANKQLQDLKKRNQVHTISSNSQASGTTSASDKDKSEAEVNIEELLNELRRDILRVYSETVLAKNAENHAK